MPSRSELPGEIKRNKFTKALERLGFIVDRWGARILFPVAGLFSLW